MIFMALGLLLFVLWVWWKVRAKRVRDVTPLERQPLAGFDTGTRSPYRLPKGSRFVRFNVRGF